MLHPSTWLTAVLEVCNNEFLHSQHVFVCTGTLQQFVDIFRHDLPGDARLVFTPAAHFRFGAGRERLPIPVYLVLVFASNQQRDSFCERKVLYYSGIIGNEPLTIEREVAERQRFSGRWARGLGIGKADTNSRMRLHFGPMGLRRSRLVLV